MAAITYMTRSDLLQMMEPLFERRGNNDCWPWIGRLTRYGYASFWVGRWFRPNKIHAHRLIFAIQYGPIPDELQACHHCDNRKCVNPRHIFLGDHADNAADREKKGRGNHEASRKPNLKNRGSGNGNSRLTTEQLQEIRLMLKDGVSQTDIAKLFPISRSGVSDIERGKSYVEVE